MSEKGIVRKVTANKILLDSYRDKPCGLCGEKQGCGNSLWGKLLNHKQESFEVKKNVNLEKGDIVDIYYDEKKLLKFSLLVYFVPLVTLLIFLAIFQHIFNNDLLSLAGSFLGLFVGIFVSRKFLCFINSDFEILISKN
jgi:sigma-E factor negative regulatory protein RseC